MKKHIWFDVLSEQRPASRSTPDASTASSATGQAERIEINTRYYLNPANPAFQYEVTYDVIDRALEYNFKPAVVFSNGTEAECREWVLRNCEEPVEHTPEPWAMHYDNDVGADDESFTQWFDAGPARIYFNQRHESVAKANAVLVITVPKLLALLEQYHDSFPTKESGKLIAEARGWTIQE